jgi:DNA-binding CsgD family transcriptional regulator/N-acetylneuraminic acid mutarotase
MAGEAPEQLSERELELLTLVTTGATNQQIARDLCISVNTVKAHLRNIFAKLGVESRTEATLLAIQQGLIHVATPDGVNGSEETAVADEAPAPSEPEPIPMEWPLRLGQGLALLAALAIILATIVWPSAQASTPAPNNRFIDMPRSQAVSRETAEASRWRSGAQMPAATGRFAQVAVGGTIYVIGGLTDEGWSADTDAYDPEQDRWSRGARKPTAVANVGAAALGGLIAVPGGLDASGTVRDVHEVYDPDADAWTTLAPLPEPRCSYAIAPVTGGYLVIGGWDGQVYVDTVYRYDAAADRWDELAPLEIPRGHAAVATWNGRVYVVGGYDGVTEYGLCESFDPALAAEGADPWRTHMPMSVGRADHAMAAVDGMLYVVGGAGDGRAAYNERYDIANDVWSTFDSPLASRWANLGLSAVTARGGAYLYAMGGWSDEYLSSVRIYQTSFRLFLP